jgi:hypothetical protein
MSYKLTWRFSETNEVMKLRQIFLHMHDENFDYGRDVHAMLSLSVVNVIQGVLKFANSEFRAL